MGINFGSPVGYTSYPTPMQPASGNNPNGAVKYQSNVNWAGVDPRAHIFDSNLEAQKMNRFPVSLGSVGFWCGGPIRRGITALFTGIPTARLQAYAVRDQLMQLPGMRPDWARVLQAAYAAHTNNQMPLHAGGLTGRYDGVVGFLAQYSAPGQAYDYSLRGPLLLELSATSMNMAMQTGLRPEIPDAYTLTALAQQAAAKAPNALYGQQQGLF